MSIEKQLGQTIIRLRKERNLSQEEMAMRMGICRRYLSDVENGRRQVSVGVVERVARVLGVSIGELFSPPLIPPREG